MSMSMYEELFATKFSTVITTLFIVMYGSLAYPFENLPNVVKKAFESPIVRIIILAFIMYTGNRDTSLSLSLALIFTLVMHQLNKLELEEINRKKIEMVKSRNKRA